METTIQTEQKLSQFSGKKYLCVETYRRSGRPVRTPVWFLKDNDVLYIYTGAKTGKVKRIRKNPYVKVASCDARGRPEGEWLQGRASFMTGTDAVRAKEMIDHKYGFQAKIARLYQWIIRRRELAVSITPSKWPAFKYNEEAQG